MDTKKLHGIQSQTLTLGPMLTLPSLQNLPKVYLPFGQFETQTLKPLSVHSIDSYIIVIFIFFRFVLFFPFFPTLSGSWGWRPNLLTGEVFRFG